MPNSPYSFLIKAALARADIEIERAIQQAQARQDAVAQQMRQYRKLEELGQTARAHPAWEAAKTGLIGSALGAIPGVLLGGVGGGLAGASLGGALTGYIGAGRPERAMGVLDEIRRGAPVGGDVPSPRMKQIVKNLMADR